MPRNQTKEISKAIEILNRKREPLLKAINAKDFSLDDAESLVAVFTVQGLNKATADLEQMRAQYV